MKRSISIQLYTLLSILMLASQAKAQQLTLLKDININISPTIPNTYSNSQIILSEQPPYFR